MEEDAERVGHSEVEEAHQTVVVQQITNIKTPTIPDTDKMLETTNQIMEIHSNNILNSIKMVNNILARNSIMLLSSTKHHLAPISILLLETCKLRDIPNLKSLNTDTKMDSLLDRVICHHTEITTTPAHHRENVHETKLSATQTEAIP